jgi:hypothetical protein
MGWIVNWHIVDWAWNELDKIIRFWAVQLRAWQRSVHDPKERVEEAMPCWDGSLPYFWRKDGLLGGERRNKREVLHGL